MRSKLSVTVYLFLALYGSTTIQSRSFLENIKNFLCKWKLVNNRSIPSTHAERKITVCSHKHSFTSYPSLSPYRWTERQTENEYTCFVWAGGTFFQLCCCVSFLFWQEIGFGFTYLRTLLNKLFTNLYFYNSCWSISYVFWRVPSSIKLRPEKRYSCLADGWNKSQITVCRVKIQTPPITL